MSGYPPSGFSGNEQNSWFHSTTGKVHCCFLSSPFLDNGSHSGLLKSQSLGNNTFQTLMLNTSGYSHVLNELIDVNNCFSHLFMHFLSLETDMSLLEIFWSTSCCQTGSI
ncbi:hypothetical protein AMECASPLE_033036 [Ameca splendens]|uniref:Uncharacterized protein n=1 Tax=Ameca splendens TaxID=208324 RepID=A0ABV0ZFI8_9TELE